MRARARFRIDTHDLFCCCVRRGSFRSIVTLTRRLRSCQLVIYIPSWYTSILYTPSRYGYITYGHHVGNDKTMGNRQSYQQEMDPYAEPMQDAGRQRRGFFASRRSQQAYPDASHPHLLLYVIARCPR